MRLGRFLQLSTFHKLRVTTMCLAEKVGLFWRKIWREQNRVNVEETDEKLLEIANYFWKVKCELHALLICLP